MANRYDAIEARHSQSDQPTQQNRYDQIEANQSEHSQPLKHYTPGEAVVSAAQHFYPSAADFGSSVLQALVHPINTIENAGDIIGGVPLAFINQLSQITGNGDIANKLYPDEQKDLQAAKNLAGYVGSRYGGWDAIKRTFAEDPVGFAADASALLAGGADAARAVAAHAPSATAQIVARAAAPVAEAGASLANPITNAGRVVRAGANKLGLNAGPGAARVVDALIPAPFTAGRVLPSFESAAQNALVSDLMEGNAPAVQNALRGVGTPLQRVAGSVPTAAQAVADDLNATRLAAAGKAAVKNLPTESANINDAQNAARLAGIQNAGAGVAAEDLNTALNVNARRDYGAAGVSLDPVNHPLPLAMQRMITSNPALINLFERPVMPQVFDRARQIAENEGREFQIGNNLPARTVPSGILGPNGQPLMMNLPEEFAQYSAQDLHTVKQAFDGMLKDPQQFGIDARQATALRNARNAFVGWFENENPEYRVARQNFARDARVVDQQRVIEHMGNVLTGALQGEDAPILRADAYANALAENPVVKNSTVRASTGQQRYARLEDLMTPAQMQALRSIIPDLARAKQAEAQARMASQYGGDLNNAASRIWGSMAPPIAQPVINYLMQNMDNRIANRVGRATLTPQAMDRMVTNVLNRQAALNQLHHGANFLYNQSLGRINRYPAVYNALQQQSQNGGKK